jgi:fructose-bisphosphate aldolase, class II
MPLVNGIDMLRKARREGYAVGGFDIFDLQSAQAVIQAAQAENSPVFLQACVRSVEHLGFRRAALIMRTEADVARVPVAVHFDHGDEITSLCDLDEALEAGFTSVMVDGSRLPLQENITLTGAAVQQAHSVGAGVEGEIGEIGRVIGGKADDVARRTAEGDDPRAWLARDEDALRLVTETGLDCLAVSVGSVSGTSSRLNLPRLRALSQVLDLPLVLHGGTGVPEEDLREAVRLGIAKVNIAHGVRRAYIASLRAQLADGANTDNVYDLQNAATQAMRQYVQSKIRLLRGQA